MADPYVIFPGTAGNYVSTEDVNKLDCDSSWFAQGTGGLWTVGEPSTEQARGDSSRSLKVTGGVSTAITPATDAADFSLFVYSAAGDDFDVNGGVPVTAPAGVWSPLSHAGNAGTYTVNAAGDGDYYLAEVMLGAVAFVPSLRIVGDLDMRADFAADDWTPALFGYLLDNRVGSEGYAVVLPSNNVVRVYHGDGTSSRQADSGTQVFVDGSRHTIRAWYDISAGTCDFALDGVADSQVAGLSTLAGSPTSSGLTVGANATADRPVAGSLFSAEVRDGIGDDAPVVARFDAGDVPQPAQLPI